MNISSGRKRIVALVAMVALVAILGICLVACNNQQDYTKRLEKAGYIVVSANSSEFDSADVEWMISAAKGEEELVVVVKFKTADAAKTAETELKNDTDSDYTVQRSGEIVIYGTAGGVKDAQ